MLHRHLFKNGPNPASFCLFTFFSHDKYSTNLIINDIRVDGVLSIRRIDGRPFKNNLIWSH